MNDVDIGATDATMMKSSATVIFMCSLFVSSCLGGPTGKTYVQINNDLSAGTTLTVRCKSKNNDIGIVDIARSWEFAFTVNFFGGHYSFAVLHQFNIYKQRRNSHDCNLCHWRISPNSPCRLNDSGEFDVRLGDTSFT